MSELDRFHELSDADLRGALIVEPAGSLSGSALRAIALAEIELRDGTRHEYGALAVSGRSGPIDRQRSERITIPPRAPGGEGVPGLRGLLFDPASWDGSDVFTPEGSTFVLVTDRVREALEGARLTNVALERITEIERMTLP